MVFIHADDSDDINAGQVEIEGVIVSERPKAIQLRVGDDTAWLPRGRIKIDRMPGGTAVVFLPKWLARAHGYV